MALSISTSLASSTQVSAKNSLSLPSQSVALSEITSFAHKVHQLWRWHMLAESMTNRLKNPETWLADWLLNRLFGDLEVLQTTAVIAVLARRILQAIEQIDRVDRSFSHLINAWSSTLYLGASSLPSAEPKFSLGTNEKEFLSKIKYVAYCFFDLIHQIFIFSMYCIDIVELMNPQSPSHQDCKNHLWSNVSLLINELEQSKCMLESQKTQVQTLQNFLRLPFNIIPLIDQSKGKLSQIKSVQELISKITGPIQWMTDSTMTLFCDRVPSNISPISLNSQHEPIQIVSTSNS